MLDTCEYRILKMFRDNSRGFYEETKLPEEIRLVDLSELISDGLLKRITLEPRREEIPGRDALCGIQITRAGRQELLLFEKERSDNVWQVLQFLTATFLAIAALPGVIDTVRSWFR